MALPGGKAPGHNTHRHAFDPAAGPCDALLLLMQKASTTKDGKSIVVRTPVTGQVGSIFKAAGVALPPNIRDAVAA